MSMSMPEYHDQTTVAEPFWAWRLMFPPLGAGGLWLLTFAANWLATATAIPMPGWLRLVATAPQPWLSIGAVGLGAAAGLALAFYAQYESLVVTVTNEQLRLERRGAPTLLPRSRIGAVFLDGKQLAVLDRDGAELARHPSDLDSAELARAFGEYGYPWRAAGDPYSGAFRRWVPDAPGLPAGAGALLAAREKALARSDTDDAADLRAELVKLGVIVRDEKTRQYWRPAAPGGNGE